MRLNYIFGALGLVLRYFGLLMLVPLLAALFFERSLTAAVPFFTAFLSSSVVGYCFYRFSGCCSNFNDLKKKEGLFIVTMTWICVSTVTAIPYFFYHLSPIDAFFEAVSGITTCGATILTDFSLYPRSFFFWRSMSQWLGGLGIIVLFIAVLPQFAVAGRQMFFAEAPGPQEDKFTPRVKDTAIGILCVYLLLTFLEIVALKLAGMPFFDAFCNTFSTIAAGGFSPNPYSVMGYKNDMITLIVTVFMFLSGVNFALQYKALFNRDIGSILRNGEFRFYCVVVLIASIVLATVLYWFNNYSSSGRSFFDAVFQIISIITSTGFASVDFNEWNMQAKAVLFSVMFIGASAGSAGGGMKIIRVQYVIEYLKNEIFYILHPKATLPIKLDKIVIPKDVGRHILGFVVFYFLIFIIIATIVTIVENNAVIGITGTAASIGNIGPGYDLIGPMSHFAHLKPLTKLLFMFAMLIGRLELIPILAMFQADFWRKSKS